jgi:hypothetical protein
VETPGGKPRPGLVLLLLVDLDPELTALQPLGGFFVLRRAGEAFRPLPTLAATYENRTSDVYGDSLIFRVHKVANALRVPEVRIAASVAHQGLAARLWSVTLGCAALYGRIPDLDPDLLHWDPDGSAPDDLWLTEVRALPADASSVTDVVLHGHLEPLTAALRRRYTLAAGLLWGNAGSALAGAARQLDRWGRAHGPCQKPGPPPPPPRPPGRRRPGPLPDRGALRPPPPRRHRHPHRNRLPAPQLLPLLPGARRGCVR